MKQLFVILAMLTSMTAWGATDDIITFADSKVKDICVANWDANGDGELSKSEAAAVTSIGSKFSSSDIASFDELNFFTSVTTIEKDAFYGCRSLVSIVIPEGVTSIKADAFRNCVALASLLLPETITTIEKDAFFNCKNIVSIVLPDNLETLGDGAFYQCTGLTSISLGHKLTSIGGQTFYNCENLSSIILPDNLETIGAFAFQGCTGLTSIDIPNSVTTICNQAFKDCSNVTSITIGSGVETIDDSFFGCRKVTSMTFHCKEIGSWSNYYYCSSAIKEITIGDEVTAINDQAFEKCKALTSVTIPNNVTSIGSQAFRDCTALTKLTLGTGLTTIDDYAFCGCSNLKAVIIPENVTKIGYAAFHSCDFTAITIPASVETIGDIAFAYCKNLTMITLHCKTVGTAFKGLETLQEVMLGDEVTDIAKNAFYNCTSLQKINLTEHITSIGDDAFYGCKALTEIGTINTTTVKDWFASCTELEAVTFGSNVREIGNYTFSSCANLKRIDFSEGLQSIGERVFADCPNVQEIILPSSLTSVGSYAFGKMPIKELVLPQSLTTIASSAFRSFAELERIVSKIVSPNIIQWVFNSDVEQNAVLIVPKGCRSHYLATAGWKSFTSIFEEGDQIAEKTYTDEQGVIYSRQTDSSTKDYFYVVTGYTDDIIAKIVIPAAIANVPVTEVSAFGSCTTLQSVTLPNSLTYISYSAFQKCTELTDIISLIDDPAAVSGGFTSDIYQQAVLQIPTDKRDAYMNTWWKSFIMYEAGETKPQREVTDEQGVKYSLVHSGDNVYYNVTGYADNIAERVTIPTHLLGFDVLYISDNAFVNSTAIKWLYIPETVTCNYKSTAFAGCSFTLALNQQTISGWSNCTFITGLELGDAVETISNRAFSECTGIQKVAIPKNVAMTDRGSDNYSPFYGCSNLQEATIECERFGNWFNSLSSSLKKLHLGSNVKEITQPARYSSGGLSGLESVTVDTENTVFDSRENCNAIIETATNTLRLGCRATKIPESVTAIGGYAFRNQTALREVTIPANVSSIGEGAFGGCTGLQQVTSYIETPYAISSFDTSTKSTAVLRVPYLKTRNYKNFDGWTFTNIVEMDGPPEQMATITFADQEAKRLCVEQYDRNGDGEISMGEAQFVTTITNFRSADLVSFDEMKYFTNVTTIQSDAFSGCKSLTSITLPDGLTTIGNSVFYQCSSLTSIVIPAGITKISQQAFSGCTKLKEVSLPDGLTEISSYAFKNCSNLQNITLPEGLTTIGNEAFYGSGLISMTLPSTLTSIGGYALAGNIIYCNLTAPISVGTLMHNMGETVLVVPTGTEQAFGQTDGWKYFIIVGTGSSNDTDWTAGQVTVTVDEPGDLRLAIVERDEDVISRLKIKGKLNSEDLQYIVEGKGKLADLESIDLSEVTFQYGGDAYASKSISQDDVWPIRTDVTNYYLAEQEQVILPGSHTPGLGNYSMTTSVYGPNLAGLFLNKGYKHIVMPIGVKKAATDVFNGCEKLQSVAFANGITEVDEGAFLNCSCITSIDLQGVDSIHANAFSGCRMLQDIPHVSGAKYIGKNAFYNCNLLLGDGGVLSLPQVDSIPEYAFYKCLMLNDVRLSDKTKYIGQYAFSGCKTLPRITLPSSLTVLPPNVFTDCSTLEKVNYTESLMQVDYTSFSNTPWMKSLSVVEGIKYMGHIALAYDTTSGVADASPATLSFREGTTSIADGFGKTMNVYPQYYDRNVTALSFPPSLRRIGNEAFASNTANSEKAPFPVKTLTLPDALEEIGEHAFAYAPALTKLTLPENLKKIGNEAFVQSGKLTTVVYNSISTVAQNLFSDCTSLEMVTIGPKVQQLPEGVFSNCTNLAVVKSAERTAPTPLNIGASAFMNCENLQRLTLPANMVEIGEQAFMGCTALKSFTASESLETIGSNAFNGCTSLNNLTLNVGLKTIGDYAFLGCTAIPAFSLPEGINSIGVETFSGCSLLTELTIPASVTKLGDNFAGDCYNLTKLTVNMKQPALLQSVIDMSNNVVQEIYGYYYNWDEHREIHYPDVTLYVPDGTKTLYREAQGWKKFDNIQEVSASDVTATNKLYVGETKVNSGMTSMIDIGLRNKITDFTAYQFDLVLPLGFTIATDAEGNLTAEKGTRYADAAQSLRIEQLAVHLYADFVKYRFLCMSSNTDVITGTDGSLLSFPLHVSEKVEDGSYKARIENVIFTQKNGTKNILDKLQLTITVGEGAELKTGDANGDGMVDVADVVAIVNYILDEQIYHFNEQAADVNGDGTIDVADVVAVVNIILGGDNSGSREIQARIQAYLKAHGFTICK